MRFLLIASLLAVAASALAQSDLRNGYDVDTYRVDLKVDPDSSTITGTGTIVATVTKEGLTTFEVDLMEGRDVSGANWVADRVSPVSSLAGRVLKFEREGDHVMVHLPRSFKQGEQVRVSIAYRYTPTGSRTGIVFHKTPDGKPWIQTNCQVLGAHSWWPCKNENEHPEDKFAHFFMNATVPAGLTAVSNGRFLGRAARPGGWTLFRWRHDYPCENYAICLDVAPYVELTDRIAISGLAKPVQASYYVLPQDAEKAKLQFEDARRMLQIYSDTFGPWPYVNEPFKLVQTDFWGEEHSTAVSYGNTFPKWAKLHNQPDRYASMNAMFDYILIHECGHEWWGNAVSAKDWGHLWIHEGFTTYVEAVYVEKTQGRERADEWLAGMKGRIPQGFSEFRGKGVTPQQAYSNNVYWKGAWILNTLRTYVNNDEQWWKALKEFNLRFRYKCAVTEDFQSVLEEITKRPWQEFFLEWFYGDGFPVMKGTAQIVGDTIEVNVDNPPQHGVGFHVPLDLEWTVDGRLQRTRVTLAPGPNHLTVPAGKSPQDLRLPTLNGILGDLQIGVKQ